MIPLDSSPVNQMTLDPVRVQHHSSTFLASDSSFDSNTSDAAFTPLDPTQDHILRVSPGLEYGLGVMLAGDPVSFRSCAGLNIDLQRWRATFHKPTMRAPGLSCLLHFLSCQYRTQVSTPKSRTWAKTRKGLSRWGELLMFGLRSLLIFGYRPPRVLTHPLLRLSRPRVGVLVNQKLEFRPTIPSSTSRISQQGTTFRHTLWRVLRWLTPR